MAPTRAFSSSAKRINRRQFSRWALATAAAWGAARLPAQDRTRSPVFVTRTADRQAAIRAAFAAFQAIDFTGRDVFLKAPFNSSDPYPASTHPDTLEALVALLRERGCGKISLVERSGMGSTTAVWRNLAIDELARRLDVTLMPLDELPPESWRRRALDGSHWSRGVEIPEFLTPETCVVVLCGVNTHRFGGHFSASLKAGIGLIAKYSSDEGRYNYMSELHASPNQRLMIAEVNRLYVPTLIVADARKVFVSGGPERGEVAEPGVVAASTDRIALDAVGVALLRLYGAGFPISRTPVFEQEQIKRAVELQLGASSAGDIEFVAIDDESRKLAAQLEALLGESAEASGKREP